MSLNEPFPVYIIQKDLNETEYLEYDKKNYAERGGR